MNTAIPASARATSVLTRRRRAHRVCGQKHCRHRTRWRRARSRGMPTASSAPAAPLRSLCALRTSAVPRTAWGEACPPGCAEAGSPPAVYAGAGIRVRETPIERTVTAPDPTFQVGGTPSKKEDGSKDIVARATWVDAMCGCPLAFSTAACASRSSSSHVVIALLMKSVVHAAARAAAAAGGWSLVDCGGTLVCATRLRCRPTSRRNALRTTATGHTEASSIVPVSNSAKDRSLAWSVLMNTKHQDVICIRLLRFLAGVLQHNVRKPRHQHGIQRGATSTQQTDFNHATGSDRNVLSVVGKGAAA